MKLIIFLALIILGFAFFEFGQVWIGMATIIAAFFYAIAIILRQFFSGSKKTAKALGKGIAADVEKAQGTTPGLDVAEKALRNVGDAAGAQMGAPGDMPLKAGTMDTYKWRFKGAASVTEGLKKIIDGFKKIMGM